MTPEKKYINKTLADLFERALKYSRLAAEPSRNTRERAIWKACAIDAAAAYNQAVRSIGRFGSSNLALEQQLFVGSRFQKTALLLLDESLISKIIEETWGISSETLEADRATRNIEYADALLKARNLNPELTKAVKILAKYKQLPKLKTLLDSLDREEKEEKELHTPTAQVYVDKTMQSLIKEKITDKTLTESLFFDETE